MTKEQRRMRMNGMIVAVLGIVLAVTTWIPLYPLAKLFLNLAHWPFSSAAATLDPTGRLMLAIGGGLTAGFGAMMWAVSSEVMPVAPDAGRKVILYSALTWFSIDSAFSVVAGSPFNAALNLIFLALMLGSIDFKNRLAAV
ncbi:hypothetical protein [Epibacterium ulvae]|uniref:hypothetical protein n=1 Tax=Epibacterium ulvae TaxID=1156985 RepID=UPI0024916E8C|nr:hypothetical protein [Epibacterium ulvae]